MSLDLHRQAEQLMGESDKALSAGNYTKAAALSAIVGQLEAIAFAEIPVDRVRTRAPVAISACSSLLQAAHHAMTAGRTDNAGLLRVAARDAIALYLKESLPDWAIQTLATLEVDTDAEYAGKLQANQSL